MLLKNNAMDVSFAEMPRPSDRLITVIERRLLEAIVAVIGNLDIFPHQ
jgi:hypothetical protein